MRSFAIKGFAISALALAVSPAMAADIRFDGFASFVAGQVLDKDEMVGLTEPNFRGYDEKLGFQNNSIFALQARADLKDRLSATAQIMAKGSNDYETQFTWAYLAYEINDEWTVKMGRSRIPYFLYSDYLDVGYSYHWIKPPFGVYDLGGLNSADGITVDYQTNFGDWVSRVSVMAGRADTVLQTSAGLGDSRIADLMVASWSMNYDWLTLRAVHAEAEVTITPEGINQLVDGLHYFNTQVAGTPLVIQESAISNLELIKDFATFDGVAMAIDTGKFFLIGEYVQLALKDCFMADPRKDWYVSGGARFGKFTYHATVEGRKSDWNASAADAITNNLAAAGGSDPSSNLYPLYAGTLASYHSSYHDIDTYSIGMRYEFHPSAAAKIEFIHQEDKINNIKPEAIGFGVDLVF